MSPEKERAHPKDIPENERMTSAEFRVIREFLNLTGDWLAKHLGVSLRTVRHWEAGRYAIPDGVRLEVENLERRTAESIARVAERLLDMPEPGVYVYRNDAEYHTAVPDSVFPASWHRAVVARVALEVPGLVITYPPGASHHSAVTRPVGQGRTSSSDSH